MVDLQSIAGSAAVEKSMHSSLLDFSSLQTQQGWETSVSLSEESRKVYESIKPLACWSWLRRSNLA